VHQTHPSTHPRVIHRKPSFRHPQDRRPSYGAGARGGGVHRPCLLPCSRRYPLPKCAACFPPWGALHLMTEVGRSQVPRGGENRRSRLPPACGYNDPRRTSPSVFAATRPFSQCAGSPPKSLSFCCQLPFRFHAAAAWSREITPGPVSCPQHPSRCRRTPSNSFRRSCCIFHCEGCPPKLRSFPRHPPPHPTAWAQSGENVLLSKYPPCPRSPSTSDPLQHLRKSLTHPPLCRLSTVLPALIAAPVRFAPSFRKHWPTNGPLAHTESQPPRAELCRRTPFNFFSGSCCVF
jgi:hypothetical protein